MTAKAAPHAVSAWPSLARGRSETTVDVRRWEVRVRGTARRVMPSDQIRRQLRAATGRKRWAAATTAPRPAPVRRRDGSACRSGNGHPRDVHDRPVWKAHCDRRPTAARRRAPSRRPKPARCARDARARTKPRAGTPAQTAPDTPPISNATGTNAWSSRFARLMPRQNHSAGTRESLLQCNIADNWAALRFIWCVAKKHHAHVGGGWRTRPEAWLREAMQNGCGLTGLPCALSRPCERPGYAALTIGGTSGLNARTWSKRSVRTIFKKASQPVRSPPANV